jgi:uncharacterized membrane protein YgdD (TMEM256/DUF423 family)
MHSVALLASAHFTAGMTMFLRSIYAMVFTGPERLKEQGRGKVLGPITLLGGVGLIIGWAMLARKGKTWAVTRSA